MSIDFNRLRVDLREDAEHVVTTLLGKPTKRSRGEFRYGTTGYALAVMIRGAKAGAWYDHETGDGGDLLALIAREHRCDFRQAVEIAEKLLQRSYTEAPRPARRVEACSNGDTDHRRLALEIFREAQPLAGSIGEKYLAHREIDLDALPDLSDAVRFHGRCPFRSTRRPCLVALFRDVLTNEARAIYRVAIDPTTLERIDERLSLGPARGCAIKLVGDDTVTQGLCVAEGLETALAGMTIMHRGTVLVPMWATGGTAGLTTFPVLPGVEALTILVDHDPINPKTGERPGHRAAQTCAQRWAEAGREIMLLTPTREGADFNDIVQEASP